MYSFVFIGNTVVGVVLHTLSERKLSPKAFQTPFRLERGEKRMEFNFLIIRVSME